MSCEKEHDFCARTTTDNVSHLKTLNAVLSVCYIFNLQSSLH